MTRVASEVKSRAIQTRGWGAWGGEPTAARKFRDIVCVEFAR